MKKWEKISDFLFFQEGPGVRNYQYTTSGVKLLNVANLVDGRIDLTTSERYISNEEAYGKYKHFLADEGDLVIASSGIKVDYFDQKMGFVKKEHLPLCMNTSTIRFKSLDKTILNIEYFMYYLKSQSFKNQLSRHITGSAQLNFGPSHLKKMEFPLVDIEDQSSINSVLGNLQNQIRLKEEQLKEYDQLIKSRFVEMFVDKYEKIQVSTKLRTTSGGTPKSDQSEYYANGTIPWLTSGEVNQGRIEKTEKFITEKGLTNSSAKWIPKKSIVIAMYGATAGKVGIIEMPTTTNQAVCAVLPHDEYNPEYLRFAFEYISEELAGKAVGGGQPNISQAIIKDSLIFNPPLEVQIKFSAFVQHVDKLKFENELLYCVNRFTRIKQTKLVCYKGVTL